MGPAGECLAAVPAGSDIYGTLDAAFGFAQLELEDGTRIDLAMSTPLGILIPTRLPLGPTCTSTAPISNRSHAAYLSPFPYLRTTGMATKYQDCGTLFKLLFSKKSTCGCPVHSPRYIVAPQKIVLRILTSSLAVKVAKMFIKCAKRGRCVGLQPVPTSTPAKLYNPGLFAGRSLSKYTVSKVEKIVALAVHRSASWWYSFPDTKTAILAASTSTMSGDNLLMIHSNRKMQEGKRTNLQRSRQTRLERRRGDDRPRRGEERGCLRRRRGDDDRGADPRPRNDRCRASKAGEQDEAEARRRPQGWTPRKKAPPLPSSNLGDPRMDGQHNVHRAQEIIRINCNEEDLQIIKTSKNDKNDL